MNSASHDLHGLALSGANAAALDAFEQACHSFRCHVGDPLALARRAIEGARAGRLAEPAGHRADLTLIEAAARDGQRLLADALRRERASRLA